MGGHIAKVKEHLEEKFHVRENVNRLQSEASDLFNKSVLYAELSSLTKEQLVCSVKELNEILKEHANNTEEKVYFAIKPDSSSSLIWKGVVKIVCYKIDSCAKTVDITRELSLASYWALRHGLYQQLVVKALGQTYQSSCSREVEQTHGLTSSNVLTRIQEMRSIDENECCICMEMEVEVSLSCAHGFCKQCIEEWSVDHQSCPTCRGALDPNDEFWEMPSIPLDAEIEKLIVTSVSKS